MFGHVTPLQLTDVPVAVLLVLAVASVGVYGIVLAGWSSGSTYPLLGRAALDRPGPFLQWPSDCRSSPCSSTAARCRPRRSWPRSRACGTSSRPSSASGSTSSPWSVRPTGCRSTSPRARASWPGFHTEYGSMRFAMFFLGETSTCSPSRRWPRRCSSAARRRLPASPRSTTGCSTRAGGACSGSPSSCGCSCSSSSGCAARCRACATTSSCASAGSSSSRPPWPGSCSSRSSGPGRTAGSGNIVFAGRAFPVTSLVLVGAIAVLVLGRRLAVGPRRPG